MYYLDCTLSMKSVYVNLLVSQSTIRASFVLIQRAIVFSEIVFLTLRVKIQTFNVDAVGKYGNSTNRIDQTMS